MAPSRSLGGPRLAGAVRARLDGQRTPSDTLIRLDNYGPSSHHFLQRRQDLQEPLGDRKRGGVYHPLRDDAGRGRAGRCKERGEVAVVRDHDPTTLACPRENRRVGCIVRVRQK